MPYILSAQFSQDGVSISELTPSLVSGDHTAEGLLVTLSNGTIIHIFRVDPGINGNHVGNTSRIMKRSSNDDGLSWGALDTVFDSPYDDRNINGGLLDNDILVVQFRRYNATNDSTIDLNIIYSYDLGETWSTPQVIISPCVSTSTHKIIKVPGRGYMASYFVNYYVELRFSDTGLDWNQMGYIWDYRSSLVHHINESCFSYLGDGKMMGLMRNNTYAWGGNYFQVTSADSGFTWSEPTPTNICDSFFTPSPLLFFDSLHHDIWIFAPDRRGDCGPQYNNADSKLWIYKVDPDSAVGSPLGYQPFYQMNRPNPNYYRFYGYPVFTRKSDGNYLVIFTDCYKKSNGRENADFYQFDINYDSVTSSPKSKSTNDISFRILPNPATDHVTLAMEFGRDIGKTSVLRIYKMNGLEVKRVNVTPLESHLQLDISGLSSGVYICKLIFAKGIWEEKLIVY